MFSGRRLSRADRLWEAAAVLASVAYAIVFAWPASVQPAAWVWGSHGDGLGNIVEFSWIVQAIQQGRSLGIDPNLSIPFGENLGAQPHEPLYYLAQVGIGLLAGSVVAENLLSLVAIPIAAWSMFRLVAWLTGSSVAAFTSGLAFGCCSYLLANTGGEATLAQIWIFPFVILSILKLLAKPSGPQIVITAAAVAVTTLVNFYYVLFVALAAFALGASWLAAKAIERRAIPFRELSAGLVAGALALVATIAIYELAVGNLADKASRIHRTTLALLSLAASPVDFILPPRTNPWFGILRQQVFEIRLLKHPGVYTDFSELSIPLPILVLAVAGAVILLLPRFSRLRDEFFSRANVIAIVGVGLLGVWLLVPPFGRRYGLTFLSLEFDIWSVAPQYASFYRAGLLVVLAACVLAGVAVAALSLRRPRVALLVALLTVAGVFVENFTLPADRVLAVAPLPAYSWLIQHPGDYAVADYPLLPPGSGANEYTSEFYQRFHGHPLINGSIGNTDVESMREEFRDPNRPGVAGALAALGIRYVLWHTDVIEQFAPLNQKYADLIRTYKPDSAGYRLAASFTDGSSVFEVVAGPAPSFAFYASGFGQVVAANGTWVRPTQSEAARIDLYATDASSTPTQMSFHCKSDGPNATLTAGGRDWAIDSGADASIAITSPVSRGVTTTSLRFTPDSVAQAGQISCSPIAVGDQVPPAT